MIFVYVTSSSLEEAKKISKVLLEKKLIACANIFPIESFYTWEEEVCQAKEYVLILKTLEEKFELIKQEISVIHSYKVPCITKIETTSNQEFSDWVKSKLSSE